MPAPVLLETIGIVNLVAWDGRVWAVPQSLGPLDLDNDEHRARPGIVAHADIATARSALGVAQPAPQPAPTAAPAPAPPPAGPYLFGQRWPVTWWRYTGEMGPWRDNDGNATEDEEKRNTRSPLLESIATGERRESNDLPIGACFDLKEDYYQKGADGVAVCCWVPSANRRYAKTRWTIDSRASNCTSPCLACGVAYKDHREPERDHEYQDAKPAHRCWIRHGTVGEPIHVDKDGETCQAGGGSIQTDGWHGHLIHGILQTD